MRISDWSSDVCSSDIGRHPVAGVKPAIDADVHPARRVELRDGARRRREGARVFGVDPAFDRMALEADLVLRAGQPLALGDARSEEHTSELQSLMRISYAVFCLKKKTNDQITP